MNKVPGSQPRYYSGLSGLQLPIPKYEFPPPFEKASRLTYYATLFNSIEFNSSFYKIPQEATVTKWSASVSDEFRFTFKLWKGITHQKGLQFNKDDVASFITAINAVQDKKGCLLIQFPPSLDIKSKGQLDSLLCCIQDVETTPKWKVAVEFRNKSWYHEDIYELLDVYNTALVLHDIPKSATPLFDHSSEFMYIRFHGPTGNYRESYSEDFMQEYSTYIHEWIEEGKMVLLKI